MNAGRLYTEDEVRALLAAQATQPRPGYEPDEMGVFHCDPNDPECIRAMREAGVDPTDPGPIVPGVGNPPAARNRAHMLPYDAPDGNPLWDLLIRRRRMGRSAVNPLMIQTSPSGGKAHTAAMRPVGD
jgi:hypothetical protein